MREKVLLLGMTIGLFISLNAQIYSLKSSCLENDWVEVDTCSVEKGTLLVIHHEKYKIHAYCKETNTEDTQIDVQAIFKRTSYPNIGYSHVFSQREKDNLIAEMQYIYGGNEYRITDKLAKREKKKQKKSNLLAKNK